MIFQGLLVARNCRRTETAPLTILAIKRALVISQKNLRATRGWKFSITIEF